MVVLVVFLLVCDFHNQVFVEGSFVIIAALHLSIYFTHHIINFDSIATA
jgi:hypothetical protein